MTFDPTNRRPSNQQNFIGTAWTDNDNDGYTAVITGFSSGYNNNLDGDGDLRVRVTITHPGGTEEDDSGYINSGGTLVGVYYGPYTFGGASGAKGVVIRGTPLAIGAFVVIENKKYRINEGPSFEMIPYPTPEKGQTWLREDKELLVLADGSLADLTTGDTYPVLAEEIGNVLVLKGGY